MLGVLRGRLREQVLRAANAHGAKSIAVFGSVARGGAGPESDVDFLVEFEPGRSLLDLLHLSDDLEELLGCSVDVLSVGD
jgi:predicted nucleotidyltransferase